MTPSFNMIATAWEDGVFRITLRRPPLNILNIAMMKELRQAFDEARERTDARLLLLEAEGKAFSAGVDIAEHTEDLVADMMAAFGGLFTSLAAVPFPTLAVVRGAALGGGCELAVMCDMIVAGEKAKFGQPEIMVGVFPPVAAAAFPRLMGRSRAIEWILSGDALYASEAHRVGIVNAVFPEQEFDAKLHAFISRFTRHSARMLALAKRAVDLDSGVMAHLHRAEELYLGEMMQARDAREGLAAFLEKRSPTWTHS